MMLFCNIDPCPSLWSWTDWTTWSECEATGVGCLRRRSRQCVSEEENDYKFGLLQPTQCQGMPMQSEDCECPKQGQILALFTLFYTLGLLVITLHSMT